MTRGLFSRYVAIVLLSLTAVLANTIRGYADPIVITNTSRIAGRATLTNGVSVLATDSFEATGLPTSGTATLRGSREARVGSSTATVSGLVTSDIGSNRIAGSGQFQSRSESTTSAVLAGIGVDSRLTVSFALLQPHGFRYMADFSTTHNVCDGCFAGDGGIAVAARLTRDDSIGDNHVFLDSNPNGASHHVHSGLLGIGVYTLFASAIGDFISFPETRQNADLRFNLTLDLTPVAPTPEPATVMLFGLGLVAAFARVRQHH